MTRHRWALAAGVYVLLSAALLARFWTLSASPIWDALNYFYPAFAHLSDALREGRLPLWDPYTNCGLPFHADPQAPTLNPLALLLGLAVPRPALGFVVFWVAHWIGAGLGMLVLVRALGGTPAGGVVAALAWAFSGFFVGHAQHTSWIVAAAWLPFAVGLSHLAVSTGRAGFALLAGAAMGLSSLGGYPVLVGVGPSFLALWLAAAFLGPWARFEGERPSRRRAAWRIVATLAAVTAILLLVWSPVLHAFLVEAREYTDRSGPVTGTVDAALHPYSGTSAFHPFTVAAAISLLFPHAIVPLRPFLAADLSINDAYVGIVALPLAWVAATARRRSRRAGWLLGVAAVMFAVSATDGGPIARGLAALVPPMRYMRHNGGYRVFALLPLAAAAGLGASLALASPRARARLRSAFVVTAAAALLVGSGLAIFLRARGVGLSAVLLARLYGPAAVILVGAALALWGGCARRGRTRLAAALVALFALDQAAHVHVAAATVAVRRKWILETEGLPRGRDPAGPREAGLAHDSLNLQQLTRAPVARGYVTMQRAGFNEGLARGPFLDVLRTHRYWLAPAAAVAPGEAEVVAALAGLRAQDPIPVFVDRESAALPGEPRVPGTFGSVRVTAYEPEHVALEAEVPGPRPAILASTERFAPGWRVAVDGVPALPLRVNAFFRGVSVPPGRHAVAWTYAPARWWTLVGIAALALAGALACGAALLLRDRRLATSGPAR